MTASTTKPHRSGELTLGPLLFNWPAERWRDFYAAIADEAPVEIVYLGEVVCSKRAPLQTECLADAAERLRAAGKRVIFATLAEVTQSIDRRLIDSVVGIVDATIEANDASALRALAGRPHHVGPYINVYNEDTLAVLAARGAVGVCLSPELPRSAVETLARHADAAGVAVEVQAFGRAPLALSARCYHARAHGRTKDSCQYVCEEDADGMTLDTLSGRPFLAINGIQTLSHACLNLAPDVARLAAAGVSRFRLSPHGCDMAAVARAFRDLLDGRIEAAEATARLSALGPPGPFANGFLARRPGYRWVETAGA